MLALHELQSQFRRFITDQATPDLIDLIEAGEFDPASLLSIYRNNTLITLTEALSATFPVVRRLVGERFFDYAAHEFVRDNLPSAPCLAEYGDAFPTFLATFPPAAATAYLPDVARLEWAINRVIHSDGEPAISIQSLVAVGSDAAQLGLRVIPTVRYLASKYPIHRVWQANRACAEPELISLEDVGEYLEIRRTDVLRIRSLVPADWTFRAQIANRAALGAAVEAALTLDPNFDLSLALATIFEDGLVAGFENSA